MPGASSSPSWVRFPQWERQTISERTRDALRHKRSNGERTGNVPYGFRLAADGKHVEPDSAEQAAVLAIHSLRAEGHSLRGIATTLNSHGHRTRRGTAWKLESVNRVVKRVAK